MSYELASETDHRILKHYLSDGQWHKQKDISRATGLRGSTVRQICQTHPTVYLGNVSKGYCLVDRASREDIDHAINSLRSRARKISERADALERHLGYRVQPGFFDAETD